MNRLARFFFIAGLVLLPLMVNAVQTEDQLASSRVENLNLIRFSGTVANPSRTGGVVGVTFSIYADADGAQLLWSETQNVRTDRQGRYTVLLGAESGGVPPELFAGESARWLGARTADGRESKTLLVSVPYALKAAFAGNAETLAGQPASSFITRQEIQNSQIVLASGAIVPLAANGTTGKLAKFTSTDATNADIGDSSITEFSGTASCTVGSPCIGIGIDTPERTLHVKGASGAMLFDAGNIASNPVLFFAHDNFASKFRNRIMLDRTNESMQIWSQNGPRLFVVGDKVGINVAAPTQTLDVAGAVRAGGGIIFGDGSSLTTASNVSTVTSITAGAGLSGGGSSGAVSLQVQSCATGQVLKSTGVNSWSCAEDALGLSDPNRNRGINYIAGCDTCSALADADDQRTFYQNVIGVLTIVEVRCFSDAGNPIVQVQKDDGSPANMLTPNLVCSSTGQSAGGFVSGENILQLNDRLDFHVVTAGGTAKRVTMVIKAVVN